MIPEGAEVEDELSEEVRNYFNRLKSIDEENVRRPDEFTAAMFARAMRTGRTATRTQLEEKLEKGELVRRKGKLGGVGKFIWLYSEVKKK